MIKLLHGDCLELMKNIPDGSIDMILCDLPYGATNRKSPSAKWDKPLPFDKLWEQYKRLIKPNGAIVLFASGMFTSDLMQSNRKMWRYNLVWDKVRRTGFLTISTLQALLLFQKSIKQTLFSKLRLSLLLFLNG